MLHTLLIVTTCLGPLPGLHRSAQAPWVPTTGPMLVNVPYEQPDARIVLMAHDGRVLEGPMPIVTGEPVDLLSMMPTLATIDEAAYVQLLHGDTPTGSAYVITPALSRRVPTMERITTPERGEWDRVAGWRDEGVDDLDDAPEGTGIVHVAALAEPAPRDAAVVRSGWWVQPEVDVLWDTDHGPLRFDLREDAAPMTCRNFMHLVQQRFYDGTIAHRILIKGRNGRPFVVQGGDPTGSGTGGPGWWLPLEPSTLGHAFGVLSMARADDPDSAGSQWFIALDRAETARLDGQYCAFADAVDGKETIISMATTPVGDADYLSSRPIDPPRINRMWIEPAPPRDLASGRPDDRVSPPNDGPWQPTADTPKPISEQ